jgi:hypothetical protein
MPAERLCSKVGQVESAGTLLPLDTLTQGEVITLTFGVASTTRPNEEAQARFIVTGDRKLHNLSAK